MPNKHKTSHNAIPLAVDLNGSHDLEEAARLCGMTMEEAMALLEETCKRLGIEYKHRPNAEWVQVILEALSRQTLRGSLD